MTFITADPQMARRLPAAPLPTMGGNAVLVLFSLYPLLRFAVGSAGLAVLGVSVLLFCIPLARSMNKRVLLVLPLCLLTVTAASYAYAQGDSIVGNYFFFQTLYFASIPLLCITTVRYDATTVRVVSLAFIALCFLFLAVPDLTNYGSDKFLQAFNRNIVDAQNAQDSLHDMIGLSEDRFHAYFIHSNEFGLFAAGLFIIQCKLLEAKAAIRLAFIDLALAGAILFLILVSQSITAIYIVAVTVLSLFAPKRALLLGTFAVFSFLFVTQFFYATNMADFLQEGSFWWRYIMADEVFKNAPLFRFSPQMITELENWPHSILLDVTFVAGKFGSLLLYATVALVAFIAVPPSVGAGLFAFFTCAALQPSGAMPTSFLILLLALTPHTAVERLAMPRIRTSRA
jgi:hypothetical protein